MKRIETLVVLFVMVCLAVASARAATRVVNKETDSDDGHCDSDCSLREAIDVAAQGDTIVFAANVRGTITLTLGELVIDRTLTIVGPDQALLTLSGGDTQRILTITATGQLTASGLTFAHGKGQYYTALAVEAAGAVLASGGFAFSDCTFSDNHADGTQTNGVNDAAVLYSDAYGKTLSFTRCTFQKNTAGGGACLDIDGGTLTITDSTFIDNSGPLGPACVIGNSQGPLTILGTTFVGNAARAGGALFLSGSGGATIVNSTLTGNSSSTGSGAGIYVFGSTSLTLSNVTLSGNDAVQGANLYVSNGATVTMRNTIVADTNSNCGGPGMILSHGYNLDTGSTCGLFATGDQSDTPAQLTALAKRGGRTPTMALVWDSAAVDAGNPAAPGSGGDACPAADQRGVARPQFGRCDIGAFETTGPETVGDSGFHAAHDDSLYSWPPQAGVTQYETRRSGSPRFTPPCVGITTSGTSWSDFAVPLSRAAFFYLNRPLAPQLGTWGWSSAGVERTTVCP